MISFSVFALPSAEGIQIYHKNLQLSAENKQKIADDISRYHQADNIWDVLREEFSLPHYESNPLVQDKIDWFMNNQDYLLRSATRAAPYLYYILQQVKKRHLPAELVLLPIIESGYNPFSFSNMGAAGIWQLMPDTASGLGIKQNAWYDGRLDIIASTRAALNYLAYLQDFFDGKWLLAIAAYNTGEGNVLSAIRRNIRDGRPTDFWSLPVAQQTKDYVPSLLALAVIISRPDLYPLYFPTVRNAPYLAQVDMGKQINLKYAALLAGLTHKKLMELNPGFSQPSTAKGPYRIVLPIENVEQFSENLARSPLNTPIKWYHYKIKSGDTLASISKKYAATPSSIQKLNHLANTKLRPGTQLLIPNQQLVLAEKSSLPQASTAPKVASLSTKLLRTYQHYTLQPGDTIYMVRANDTLIAIAKRFKLDSKIILAVNQLRNTDITPGKQLIIPTHGTAIKASDDKAREELGTIYIVQRGDTIAKIAQKFNTTGSAIRIANLIDEHSLLEGEKLVVPAPIRS